MIQYGLDFILTPNLQQTVLSLTGPDINYKECRISWISMNVMPIQIAVNLPIDRTLRNVDKSITAKTKQSLW